MPITFDTLEELQEFYKSFKLDENARTALKKAKAKVGRPKAAKKAAVKPAAKKTAKPASKKATAKKATAKPSAKKALKPVAKRAVKPAIKKAVKPAAKKAAPKPTAKKAAKPVVKKLTKPALKKAPPKKPAAAKNSGATLTGKIRATIQTFLDHKKSFTANDIYADLSQRDKTVNKQSVITSVLKQMNSTFKTIPVTERPGNGPRPVKLYNP